MKQIIFLICTLITLMTYSCKPKDSMVDEENETDRIQPITSGTLVQSILSQKIQKVIEVMKTNEVDDVIDRTFNSDSTSFQVSFIEGKILYSFFHSEHEQGTITFSMQNLAEKKIPLLNITDEGGDQLFDLATLWNDDMELIDYIPRNEETLKDPEMLVSIGMCQKLLNQAYEDTFRHFLENPKKTYLFKSI